MFLKRRGVALLASFLHNSGSCPHPLKGAKVLRKLIISFFEVYPEGA